MKQPIIHSHTRRLPRRRFLQFSAAALSGIALSNCQGGTSKNSTASPSASTNPGAKASGTLNIYTWADYSDPDVYKRFTEKTGVQVVADVYDSNETMLAKMQAGGGNQYSILYPSDYMVKQMIELEALSEIDASRITGLDALRDKWKSPPYDPENKHSVPVSWGTTGFLYNSESLKTAPEDWDYLWDEKSALPRRMTLLDDVREVMGATLKFLGYSYNATDPKQLEEAYQKLRELKPAIASFESFGWEDRLIAGDLSLCMSYSIIGNALPVEHPTLKFVIPKSGTSVWTDTMAIPKTAPNVDAAYAWINFMLEPENAAYAVEKLKFATPSQAAFDLLPTQLKENAKLFPPQEFLDICEGIAPVGEATELYDRYWTDLKSS